MRRTGSIQVPEADGQARVACYTNEAQGPDIAMNASHLTGFVQSAGQEHYEWGLWVAGYLLNTKSLGITYGGRLRIPPGLLEKPPDFDLWAGSRRRWLRTGKKDRFVPGTPSDPDADAAVRPVRAGDGQCALHRHCGAHCLEAVSNRHRAEK